MNRLKFISFLASLVGLPLAAQDNVYSGPTYNGQEPEPIKPAWEPTCPICFRRDEDIEVITQEDGLVIYLCSEGHVFGEPKEFRVKVKDEE